MVAAPDLRVLPSGSLSRALKHRPAPGAWQQPAEQILAAVLGNKVGAPPTKPAFLPRLTCPRHHELRSKRHVDVRHRNRRSSAPDRQIFDIEHAHRSTFSLSDSAAPPASIHASTFESLNFHNRPTRCAGSDFDSIQR